MRTVPRDIRLYCLCGLKMRITVDMYGKPGKCISCRQKFWVPKPGELPENDTELRLSEHPELLRRAGDRIRPDTAIAEQDDPDTPIPPVAEVTPEMASKDSSSGVESLGGNAVEERLAAGIDSSQDSEKEEPSAPLEDLEPLRQILAYQYLVDRESQAPAAKKNAGRADTDTRRAYDRVIERAKTRVEQRLRELLYDTGRRLAEVLGEIAQTTLKFRVGEVSPDAYFENVAKLRLRREWLNRQRLNLKLWMRTEDVHLLGGPGGVTLENMNLNRVEVFLPAEEKDDRTLLKKYIGELRVGFDHRMLAERRRTEWRRMVREGEMPQQVLRDGPLQANADMRRAKARIVHARARLRQVVKDCDTDISALQAYQQLLSKGLLPRRRGEMTAESTVAEARTISRAVGDLRQWRNQASNAAHAEDPGDLPLGPPTIFRRLAEPNELRRFARESVPAYVAALCLMLLALLSAPMVKLGFLAGMVVMVIIPAFSNRARRGTFYAALWVIESFFMALAWRFASTGLADPLHAASPFHLAGMIVASLGAWTAIGFSATMVLRKIAGHFGWAAPTAGTAAAVLFALAVLFPQGSSTPVASSSTASTMVVAAPAPIPAVETPLDKPSPTALPTTTEQAAPKPPTVVSTKPVPMETTTAVPKNTLAPVRTSPGAPTPASPLPSPTASTAGAPPVAQRSKPDTATAQNAPATTGPTSEEPSQTSTAATATSRSAGPAVELRGVMQKEGDTPRFRIVLTGTGGRDRTMDIMLGDTVYGPWKALEYSALTKKLTLSNAKRLVVLDTGETVDLLD